MGTGLILGIIIAILLGGLLFFVYGVPAFWSQQREETDNINIEIPNPLDQNEDQDQNPPPTY